jgi:hypothetical protein
MFLQQEDVQWFCVAHQVQEIGLEKIVSGHLEKLPYCKRTKAESAALP